MRGFHDQSGFSGVPQGPPRTARAACKNKSCRGGAFLAVAAFIATTQGVASPAFGDAKGTANSKNWFFNKYSNLASTDTTYWSAANALAATYSEAAQAWNEGGTTGLQVFGPDTKFNGPPLANKRWNSLFASVPAPGTTSADGSAFGSGTLAPGTLWGINYEAFGIAGGTVDFATIPAGGYGKGYGKVNDPWQIDLPVIPSSGTSQITVNGQNFTASPGDSLTMHTFLDMSGSSLALDSTGGGSMGWHTAIDGINTADTSGLFDYQFSAGPSASFHSTLTVAQGVKLFLNDFTPTAANPNPDGYNVPLEFDSSTAVTASQLKAYLDSFAGPGGWLPGSNKIFIGMQFDIPNSALGNPADNPGNTSQRYFDYQSDVTATAYDATTPEPAAISILALGGFALLILPRMRARPDFRNLPEMCSSQATR